MRKIPAFFGLAAILVAPSASYAQCRPQNCIPGPGVLRLSPVLQDGVPLIWSSSAARLVPPPSYGMPVLLGHVVPLDGLIGRRILPVGQVPRPVSYNSPASAPGAVDPGIVLMPLLAPRHPDKRRGAYP